MKREVSVYLDFLRLIASLAVFLGHSYGYTGKTWGYTISGFATDAVAVFFVISGFVIAYVTTGREKSLAQYAIARLGRLYSVAIPAVLLTLACDTIGLMSSSHWYIGRSWFNPDTSPLDVLRYLMFSNEYWDSHVVVGSDEPYWSIGFEASYYAIYAALIFPARSRFLNPVIAVLFLLIAGPKIAAYLPLWLIGVAVFFLLRNAGALMQRVPFGAWALVLICTLGLYGGLRLEAHYHPAWKTNMFDPFVFSWLYLMQVLYYTAVGLLTGLSIIAVANMTPVFSVFARTLGNPIRWLAGGTFTLYLIHQPILLMLVSVFPANHDTVGRAIVIQATTLVLVFFVAEFTERRKAFWTTAVAGVISLCRRWAGGFVAWSRPS